MNNDKKEWVEKLMRGGFVANGIVYITIGILAIQAAFGAGGRTTGSRGAISSIATQPFGQFLLGLIGIGLIGLTLWYFIRGISDPDDEGDDAEGIMKRIGLVIAGLGYGILAYSAFTALSAGSSGGGGGGSGAADWTARIMQQPFGIWLVGIVGAIIIGVGLYQIYKGYQAKFREKLDTVTMSREERKWGIRAGQFGISARGVIFAIIGIFLIQAALQADPQEAGGVGQALQTLANQPYGPWVLGIIAFGFIAYGLYSAVVLSRYREIQFQ